jgi:YD repeat-containing protein
MFTTQKLFVGLGIVFFFGSATASDLSREEHFGDGSRIEYNAAGNPVRVTDSSGKTFATAYALPIEQIFDDGSRIEYTATWQPVRFTDTKGDVFATKLAHAVASPGAVAQR